jgi:hypothetical protein
LKIEALLIVTALGKLCQSSMSDTGGGYITIGGGNNSNNLNTTLQETGMHHVKHKGFLSKSCFATWSLFSDGFQRYI